MKKKLLIVGAFVLGVALLPVAVNAAQDYRVVNASEYIVDTFEHEGNKCYVAHSKEGDAFMLKAVSTSTSISCVKK